jgi:hypothetical protein
MTDERSTPDREPGAASGASTEPGAASGAGTEPAPPDEATQPAPPDLATQPAPPAVPPEPAAPAAATGSPDATQPAPAAVPPAAASVPPPPLLAGQPESRGRSPLRALRSIAVGLVFFLTCLSLVVATTAWWVDQTFLDTDAFVAVAAPLVDDPEVQEALAQATADQVAEAIDLGPLGSYVAVGIARELYGSDAFAQLWEQAMRGVHTVLVAVLRDESNVVDMVDDQVYINLYPFLDRILDRLATLDLEIRGQAITLPVISDPSDPAASRAEIEAALGRSLPETFGIVPVARGERLVAAQQAFSIVVLAAIMLLLAILTIAIARRRIRMIALLGVGVLASLLVTRLLISAIQDWVADAVTGGGNVALVGNQVVDALAASYRELTQVAVIVALVAAVVATIVAWVLDRRVRAEQPGSPKSSLADGWFLALAGLCVALGALIVVGLTLGSFVIVAIAYVAWLVVVARTRARAKPDVVAA